MNRIISGFFFRLVAQHGSCREQSHCPRQLGRGLPKLLGITLTRSYLLKHFKGGLSELALVVVIDLKPQENDENLEREQRIAGPKFDLLATATLRLEEAGEEVDIFYLC